MKTRNRQVAVRNVLPWLALALSACGSNGDAPSARDDDGGRTLAGQAAKGPLDNAVIEVFVLDSRGRAAGAALARAATDANGNWSLSLPDGNQPLVAMSSGGRYVDEADPQPDPAARRSVLLGPDDRFAAVVPPGARTVAINAYTDALLRKSRAETEGDNFYSVFSNNRRFATRAFGFDPITTLPADPNEPAAGASGPARQYAMALGGIANVVNAYAIANGQTIADFAIIDAVIEDLTDCSIDGRGIDGPVQPAVTVTRDINTEILRFRNNNPGAYLDTVLLEIDTAECARSGRIADVVAPRFGPVAGAVTLAAVDAQGVPAVDPAVQAVLAAVTATDDRDGAVVPQSNLPAVLPLGDNPVTFTATDRAGNIARIVIVFTVADLDAPTIVAPPDRDVDATGALTQVALGVPTVADNVTPADRLAVTSDAPAQGFPPGIHLVTWQVTDAAGLSAVAMQTVTVRNDAPVVVAPPADQVATEGQPFSLSLAGVFTDSDSSLTLSLTGLPAGSGLAFEAGSAVLAGIPNDTDAQAAPLVLTVSAQDETTVVSHAFVLAVIDVNNAPSFSTSGDVVLDEDFAGAVTISVTPDPVTPGDVNDVIYTLQPGSVDFAALTIDPVSGAVTVTSLPDANGHGTLRITADDGAGVNNLFSREVAVTVNAVNDAPVFALSGVVEVVPGFNGTALVDVLPGPVPADEAAQAVSYSIAHSVAYASISIDAQTGRVSISDVADVVDAAAIIAVTGDDGQSANNTHTQMLSFVVRESDKLVYAGEPVDDQAPPIAPVFPHPSVVPLSFQARDLPASLSLDAATGILSGTPTEADADAGVFAASITVTGSDLSAATFPLVIRVVERDTDFDGLPDRFEGGHGTDPYVADTDGDSVGDGIEIEAGTDPLVPSARVMHVTTDEALSSVADSLPVAATAGDPVFVVIEPGVYHAPLRLGAPCNNVTVVGGLPPGAAYPQPDQPTVLTAPVVVDGCAAAGLHHLGVLSADNALTVTGASLTLGTVALHSAIGQVLDVHDSTIVMSESVVDMTTGRGIALAQASVLRIDDSLLSTTARGELFDVDGESRVELERVETAKALVTQASVIVGEALRIHRRLPDAVRLGKLAGNGIVATLTYRDYALRRGYKIDIRHGGDALTVHDINRGRYLFMSDESLTPEALMLYVEGRSVPFVIDSAGPQ